MECPSMLSGLGSCSGRKGVLKDRRQQDWDRIVRTYYKCITILKNTYIENYLDDENNQIHMTLNQKLERGLTAQAGLYFGAETHKLISKTLVLGLDWDLEIPPPKIGILDRSCSHETLCGIQIVKHQKDRQIMGS